MAKQLTSKTLFIYLVYSNLKRTPPKEYPDTNEMVVTVDEILPALEAVSGQFVEFRKQADTVNNDLVAGVLTQEEAQAKINELQKAVRAFEQGDGLTVVAVELSASAFGILNQQFERWGKTWFDKLEDFVSFKKDITKTSQS